MISVHNIQIELGARRKLEQRYAVDEIMDAGLGHGQVHSGKVQIRSAVMTQ